MKSLSLGLLFTILNSCSATLEVCTTSGTVHGFIDKATPRTAQFLGIPFAEPPVNSLRWLPPVKKSPVDSINASKFGASCPQIISSGASIYTVDASDLLISGPTSEDCLTLNIWKPLSCHQLPVIVWLYGGAFQTGGGEIPYQIPTNWVERSQKHIVVGINYRLNIFGFPNAAGLEDLNLGLLDQRLGLEWVRSNIAAFGGDPSRITLWGQSAGGESVDYYNFAYPEDPIVSGIILDSGTALLPSGTYDDQRTNFAIVSKHFGCQDLDCMRKVSSVEIEAYLKAYGDNGTQPALSFNPVNDEKTKFANYTARALAGNYTKVPAIIGTNVDEGRAFIAFKPDGPDGPGIADAESLTLSLFLCPAVQTMQNRVNAKTYRYLYSGNFSNISPRSWEGAYHSADLPMYFGTSELNGKNTAFETAVSQRMQDLWVGFAEGEHRLEEMGWAEAGETALEFGKEGVVESVVQLSDIDSRCS